MFSSKIYVASAIVFILVGFVYHSRHHFIRNEPSGGKDELSNSHQQAQIMDVYNALGKPEITEDDIIYNLARNTVPIVNEEYKIIFFQVAKIASSEWTRFFIRLNKDPNWCTNERIHDREVNGLKYLTDFTKSDAEEMMTNTEWTKAIFVRHPKPRILSAFLDKAVERSHHFEETTCKAYSKKGGDLDDCLENHKEFSWFLKHITTTLPENVHWRSISSRIDEKWWPHINFVGYMESLSDDAKSLLQSIHSNVSGKSAWDEIGKFGWSDNERSCDNTVQSDGEFLAQRDARHKTSARDKMLMYYTPGLENFVERHYAEDLNTPYFQFDEVQLFRDQKH
mmetsp:Transcript_16980/g.25361  ORF Transcript_16980/g.25361 Transcript_16980/m.25361 type:complete len:338 (-) Transcript_16980:154-1167(-)